MLLFRAKYGPGWMDGWEDGWMDGWAGGWMDGREGGWMVGWMDGKARLRIAYSNQKIFLTT